MRRNYLALVVLVSFLTIIIGAVNVNAAGPLTAAQKEQYKPLIGSTWGGKIFCVFQRDRNPREVKEFSLFLDSKGELRAAYDLGPYFVGKTHYQEAKGESEVALLSRDGRPGVEILIGKVKPLPLRLYYNQKGDFLEVEKANSSFNDWEGKLYPRK